MLGDMIGEFRGKVTAVRVLSEGKVETSEQGSGSILGVEATMLATAISTFMPNGVIMGEGDAIVTTMDGEVVTIKKSEENSQQICFLPAPVAQVCVHMSPAIR